MSDTAAPLSVTSLIRALDCFGGRYSAIHVFADDLQELRDQPEAVARRAQILAPAGCAAFPISCGDSRMWSLIVTPQGVVRLARRLAAVRVEPDWSAIEIVHRALHAASATKEGLVRQVFGLLVRDPPWVLTLEFVPVEGWMVYDGGLVPWMKAQLYEVPTCP